jgi:hypothetical protein
MDSPHYNLLSSDRIFTGQKKLLYSLPFFVVFMPLQGIRYTEFSNETPRRRDSEVLKNYLTREHRELPPAALPGGVSKYKYLCGLA